LVPSHCLKYRLTTDVTTAQGSFFFFFLEGVVFFVDYYIIKYKIIIKCFFFGGKIYSVFLFAFYFRLKLISGEDIWEPLDKIHGVSYDSLQV
jgi:hypothetical protein